MSQALVSQDVLIDQAALAAARPAAVFEGLKPEDESLSEGIGSGYAVIGYRGKNWTLRYRGNTFMLVRPDDRTPTSYIDLVVLRKAPMKSKSYYPKEAGFNPDDIEAHKRPTCSSMDGIVPDAEVLLKQSDTCALCPRNEWKMQPNTKMGRECADYMRMSVILMPEFSALVLGEPLGEPVFLKVPAASLSGLAEFGRQMEKSQFHMSTYVMRIMFKPEKSWPEFRYQFVRALNDKEGAAIVALREDPQAKRIVGHLSQPAIAYTAAPNQVAPSIGHVVQTVGLATPPAAPAQPTVQGAPAVSPEVTALATALAAQREGRIAAIRAAETGAAPAAPPSPAPAQAFLELKANPPAPTAPAAPPSAPPSAPPPPSPETNAIIAVGVAATQLGVTQAPQGFLAPTPPPPSTAAVSGPTQAVQGGFTAPAEEIIGSSPEMDAIIASIAPKA